MSWFKIGKELWIKSGTFILLGIILFVVKGLSIEYVDASGILHENFFLIPLGYICILFGCGYFIFSCARRSIVKNDK